jgi:hypothetical protein
MTKPKRTPKETWEAIEALAREAEIDRFLAKSPAEVDASLRAAGHDPAAVRAEGAALAKRLAWQTDAAAGLARERAKLARTTGRHAGLTAAELHERIKVARRDPRLAQPAAVMFRNRKIEEAGEDELRAILEELEALAGEQGDR